MNERQVKQAVDAARNEVVFNPTNKAHMDFAEAVHFLHIKKSLDELFAKDKDAETQAALEEMSARAMSLFPLIDSPISDETLRRIFDTALKMWSATKDKGEEATSPQVDPKIAETLNISLASANAAWETSKKARKEEVKEKTNVYVYEHDKKQFTQLTESELNDTDLAKKHVIYDSNTQLTYKAPTESPVVSDEILWEVIKFGMEKFGVNNPQELKFDGTLKKQAEELISRKSAENKNRPVMESVSISQPQINKFGKAA